MRFLVHVNLSPGVAELLSAAGHDAVAVRDVGLADAPDDEILDHASAEDRVVISHDSVEVACADVFEPGRFLEVTHGDLDVGSVSRC